jgi:hypothetical protein
LESADQADLRFFKTKKMRKRKSTIKKVKKEGMPHTEAEDYHFPKVAHPCKMKPEIWLQMMEERGFKVR